jgi:hypothetical protein
MKKANNLLKLAIVLIAITSLILAVICISNFLQGEFNWINLLVLIVELSLLQSLIKIYKK